jgi:hypothetical protein
MYERKQGRPWIRIDEAVGHLVEPVVEAASGLYQPLEGGCIQEDPGEGGCIREDPEEGEPTWTAQAGLGQEEDIHGPGLEGLGTDRVLLEAAQGRGHGGRPVYHDLGSLLEVDLELELILDLALEVGPPLAVQASEQGVASSRLLSRFHRWRETKIGSDGFCVAGSFIL